MRRLILIMLLLAGCGEGSRRAPPARNVSRPPVLGAPPTRETQACLTDLSREGVRYSALPDKDFGNGCAIQGAVQLVDIGVPVPGLRAMRCGLARAFTGWVRYGVAPAAHQLLGSDVVRIDSLGTYACRAVIGANGPGNRLSGHASANAVDVAGFVLADGRRITIAGDWGSADPQVRAFFAAIRASACKRFGTVLSPDYNSAHHDHFHLEDDHAVFCR